MPGVEREGDEADCGDENTGSNTVFANEHGITRVGYLNNLGPDSAGGKILGPGSQTVFVENWKVSLPGDAIVGHGKNKHAGAITANESADVFADSGFLDSFGSVDAPDLEVVDLYVTYNGVKYSALQGGATLYTSGLDHYPPLNTAEYNSAYNQCNPYGGIGEPPPPPPGPPLASYLHGITYTIKNTGTQTSPPFKVGGWKLPTKAQNPGYNGYPMTLVLYEGITESYWENLNIKLISESQVGALKPGETFTASFVPYSPTDFLQLSGGHYWFAVFADTYGEVLEPHENNGFKVMKLTMDIGCGI